MGKRQSIEERLRARLADCGVNVKVPVVLMVSGGADSTALARLVCAMRWEAPRMIVHVNHHLRGEASDGDAAFVRALAAELGVRCTVADADVSGLAELGQGGGNIEAAGRVARYVMAARTLTAICEEVGLGVQDGCALVAHTADDRVENFYMRSIVGAGPGALRSMDAAADVMGVHVVRPLLDVTHAELCEWLSEQGFSWREDATNATDEGFRAYVRHHMVPAALARNPRLHETLGRTMDLIADEDDFLEGMAQSLAGRIVTWSDGEDPHAGCSLCPLLGGVPEVMRRRIVFGALGRMLRALDSEARVEFAAVDAVLADFAEDGSIRSGYVANIQGDLAVSANKSGVRIEPMAVFRARRKMD